MMRLNSPEYGCAETLDECVAGITGNAELRDKLSLSKLHLTAVEKEYVNAASSGGLYKIPPINGHGNADPMVINMLAKSDLIKVYDQYFVPEGKPARRVYDSLLNAAKDACPFCGGIGTPRNLDHFLPKAHFPQFSLLPRNLVPACRDCNMDGKAQAFAVNAEEQIIQPYVDNDRFFLEQWISATYHQENEEKPGEFTYFVCPPLGWTPTDKHRVEKHFADFDLAKRYATKAAAQWVTISRQIQSMRLAGLDSKWINAVLLQPGIDAAPFINHWQRGMYQSLADALVKICDLGAR